MYPPCSSHRSSARLQSGGRRQRAQTITVEEHHEHGDGAATPEAPLALGRRRALQGGQAFRKAEAAAAAGSSKAIVLLAMRCGDVTAADSDSARIEAILDASEAFVATVSKIAAASDVGIVERLGAAFAARYMHIEADFYSHVRGVAAAVRGLVWEGRRPAR